MAHPLDLYQQTRIKMDQKIERIAWWKNYKNYLYLFGLVLVLLFVANLFLTSSESRLNVTKERILTDTVKQGYFEEYIPVNGIVQPIRTVYIDAMEGGRVDQKLLEDGATVKRGQSILQLSNPELQLSYLNQEAQINAQINQIRNTSLLMEQQVLARKEQALEITYRIDVLEKQARRNKSLFNDQVIAQVEYENTQDEFEHLLRRKKLLKKTLEKDSLFILIQSDQMQSSLEMMKRNLEFAKSSLENLVVKAPIEGQLSGLNKELGELVSRGENIAQIDDLSNYKIKAQIDEFYISRIFNDLEGSFDFAGEKYTLKIKKIYPQVTNGTFEVDLVFVGAVPQNIKRGQNLTIRLQLSAQRTALLLSRGGFYQSTGGKWAYVIDPSSGNARKKNLSIGRHNPSYYEVTDGLSPGDVVITSSYESYGEKDELILK